MVNVCRLHVCHVVTDIVGKSYAHRITKTKLTLILTLILITILTLTLLTLLPPAQSWVCSNLGPSLGGLPKLSQTDWLDQI